MSSYTFYAARAVLFDPDIQTRALTVSHLRSMGFGEVLDLDDFDALCSAVQVEPPDILICEASPEVCDLITRIRRYRQRTDPFIPILLTAWQPTGDLVVRVVNSGVDGLLLKPFSIGRLSERIYAVIDQRRGFVRAGGYLGPDRRVGEAKRASGVLIEVPNALRAKVSSKGIVPTRANIIAAMKHLQRERIARNSGQIWALVETAIGALEDGAGLPKTLATVFEQIEIVTGDLTAAARESALEDVAQLSSGLATLARSVADIGSGRVTERHRKLLRGASEAISMAVALAQDGADRGADTDDRSEVA